MKNVFITSASRTAVGSLGKSLKNVRSEELGSCVILNSVPYDRPDGTITTDKNDFLEFSMQVGEELLPPIEIPKIEIPNIGELLDLNLENEDENQNKMPESTVTKPIPKYYYRIEFDHMNLRNEISFEFM